MREKFKWVSDCVTYRTPAFIIRAAIVSIFFHNDDAPKSFKIRVSATLPVGDDVEAVGKEVVKSVEKEAGQTIIEASLAGDNTYYQCSQTDIRRDSRACCPCRIAKRFQYRSILYIHTLLQYCFHLLAM